MMKRDRDDVSGREWLGVPDRSVPAIMRSAQLSGRRDKPGDDMHVCVIQDDRKSL
jgi:hypothetical protein